MTKKTPTRILIVDDHVPFRRILNSALSDVSGLEVIGEASNGLEAIEKTRELKPDIVIMDLMMPELNGVEATARLKHSTSEVRVLALTLFGESDDIYSAMKAGARGYSLKSGEFDEIVNAVKEVASGNVLITPVLATRMLRDANTGKVCPKEDGIVHLTVPEKSIIQLLSQGMTLTEIAQKRSITEDGLRSALCEIIGKYQSG